MKQLFSLTDGPTILNKDPLISADHWGNIETLQELFMYTYIYILLKKYPSLCLGLRQLRYHKLKHRFLDWLNRICSSGFDIETTSHFLFHCQNFISERSLHLNNVSGLTKEKLPSCDTSVIKLFLYGDDSLDLVTSTLILNASVNFILSSKRFDGPFYRIIIYVVNNTLKKL